MVVCSRCGELIESGWDYRWHFDKHLDEFDNAEDKQKYINETTQIMSSKFFSNKNDNKTDKRGKKVTNKGKQVHNKNIGVKKSGRGK
jgi:hypothetical protein